MQKRAMVTTKIDVVEFNPFLSEISDICSLLITFANSLVPEQDRHSVGLDLDPNYSTL